MSAQHPHLDDIPVFIYQRIHNHRAHNARLPGERRIHWVHVMRLARRFEIRANPDDFSPNFPTKVPEAQTGSFVLPFDLSYEIDLWGRVRRSVAAAREEAQATAADYRTAKLSLEAELAMDYFELCSADAQKKTS